MKAYSRAVLTALLMAGISLVSFNSVSAITAPKFGLVPADFSQRALLDIRGGASKKRKRKSQTGSLTKTVTGKKKVQAKKTAEKKKTGGTSGLRDYYDAIPRLTKLYANMILTCTALGLLLGEERSQAVLALDPMRLMYGFEFWRPFTAASFLGSPSISWLMSGYYLITYGSELEKAHGTSEFLMLLATQIGFLTLFCSLLGVPFFTESVITGMLYVLSRAMPHQKVKWLVITVPYWTLPYGLMISDCLNAKSASAALPHILGILVGHFYQFHRFIWPKTGGEDWLRAPDFLVNKLDADAAEKNAAKESLKKALQNRKKGSGKKLGSSN